MNDVRRTIVISEVFPPQVGGSGKWLWDIYKRQPVGNYTILANHHPHAGDTDPSYPQKVIRCNLQMQSRAVAKFSSITPYVSQIVRLWREVKKQRAETIHASRPLSEGLVSAIVSKLTGVPFLLFVHGEDINVAKTSRELSVLTRYVLKHAKVVIANSTYTERKLVDDWSVNKSKIKLLNPGIDYAKFATDASAPAQNTTSKNNLRIMTAGRLQKRKGHDTVIKAIAELRDHFNQIDYHIVGRGEEETALKQLASDLGVSENIHFLGEITDQELIKQYRACDIFVLANREIDGDVEGFGIVLLEAQACGKPVIAGNSGGTADTLIDGETGFLIDATDESELISTIVKRMSSDEARKRIGQRGQEYVSKNFCWRMLSKRVSNIFLDMQAK